MKKKVKEYVVMKAVLYFLMICKNETEKQTVNVLLEDDIKT